MRAKELFEEYTGDGRLVVSTQVIQEFYAAGLWKLGMPRRSLQDATDALLDLPLVIVGPSHILSATRNEKQYQISFRDGLIVAAAESAEAELLYS